jgi:hypothetical protein
MPRKASSVSEIDQILRVHSLLHDIGVAPSPRLEVVTAAGTARLGQLLRAVVGNTQSAKGWSSYGSILLATERGKVEIDYLDIVSMQKALSAGEKSLPNVFRKTRRPSKKGGWGC